MPTLRGVPDARLTAVVPLAPVAAEQVVIIAASAGGLPALQELLRTLTPRAETAYLLVLHRSVRPQDLLPSVVQRWTGMRVQLAAQDALIEGGTLYIAPADRHLNVTRSRAIDLQDGRRISRVRSSADPLFESAARAFGPNVIAVVLSGTGRNGAAGVRYVREHGGVVIAQDKATSAHFGMPAAAIETGCVDMVLPIQDIGPALGRVTDGASTLPGGPIGPG